MSLFKKPKGKFRSRVARDDTDEDGENEDSTSLSRIDNTKKLSLQVPIGESKNSSDNINLSSEAGSSSVDHHQQSHSTETGKKIDSKVKFKLSFGDEEEDEADVFQVKKSSTSKRLKKLLEKEKKKKEKEFSKQNKSNFDPLFSKIDNNDNHDCEIQAEHFEPLKNKESSSRDIYAHEFKPIKEGQFPSAKEIYAARKKREEDRKKMRMDNVIDDFIAIEEETAADRAALGLADDEQPVYEDEQDNDDDDEDDRIDFAVDREALERERAKEAFIQAQEEDEETCNRKANYNDDSEDELDLWEKEQIRKGVGFLIGSTNRDRHQNSQLNDLIIKLDLPSTSNKSNLSIPGYLPKVPNGKACEELIKQISDAIAQIEREINEDEQELRNVRSEKDQLILEVKELEEKLEESGIGHESPTELLRNWKKGETFSTDEIYMSSDDD